MCSEFLHAEHAGVSREICVQNRPPLDLPSRLRVMLPSIRERLDVLAAEFATSAARVGALATVRWGTEENGNHYSILGVILG